MTTKTSISFGKNLSKVMKIRNLRIQDVAEMAQVSKSVVHAWTTGTSPRDLLAVRRLSDALQIPFSELVFGETELVGIEMMSVDDVPFFDGYCRLRIERVIPKNKL
ncbi:MAG: hypothetical protein RIR26_2140 [Pseudomonadota bacterium]|jgi:transcriptional regulator with XRE-family HTH domain